MKMKMPKAAASIMEQTKPQPMTAAGMQARMQQGNVNRIAEYAKKKPKKARTTVSVLGG